MALKYNSEVYKEERQILNRFEKGEIRIFVEASTFLIIERCCELGDVESYNWMIKNCIFVDIENLLDRMVKRAYNKLNK